MHQKLQKPRFEEQKTFCMDQSSMNGEQVSTLLVRWISKGAEKNGVKKKAGVQGE